MPGNLDYALLAANSYAASTTPPDVSTANTLPVPSGWSILDSRDDPFSGFTARAYARGTEIVIAYAGTSATGSLLQQGRDWLFGNVAAGSGATASLQAVQAARYYLDIAAANPGKTITFTGHSLGGGLASLMAVYFDRAAVTFDTAPFEKAADSAIAVNGTKAALLAAGYSLPAEFSSYLALDFLFGAAIASPTRVAREANVTFQDARGAEAQFSGDAGGRVAGAPVPPHPRSLRTSGALRRLVFQPSARRTGEGRQGPGCAEHRRGAHRTRERAPRACQGRLGAAHSQGL